MKRTAILIGTLSLAALAGAGGLYAAMRVEPGRVAAAPPPAIPVVVTAVATHDVPVYLRGVGTLIAYNTAVVRSQIQGQLVKIAFTEGQAVKTGDLLAEIDPRPYQAQLDQVSANLDREHSRGNAHAGS
jgi:membrane fusion protein, multidrug efflux system